MTDPKSHPAYWHTYGAAFVRQDCSPDKAHKIAHDVARGAVEMNERAEATEREARPTAERIADMLAEIESLEDAACEKDDEGREACVLEGIQAAIAWMIGSPDHLEQTVRLVRESLEEGE